MILCKVLSYYKSSTGFLYVCLLLASIFVHKYFFLVLMLVFSIICLFEFQRLIHFKKPILYFILIAGFIAIHYLNPTTNFLLGLLAITLFIQLLLLKDLLFIRIIPMFEKKKYVVTIFYLITCFYFLTLIPFSINNSYTPIYIISLFILIWTNDSFAYLSGKNFGKRKLYSKISPKKTIEGFIGGLLAAIIGGIIIFYTSKTLSIIHWVIIAVIVSIFGTIGDLIQSKFKRQAGVKDSGTIMPGHGGIFDRLDSILYASPFVFLYLQILTHVS